MFVSPPITLTASAVMVTATVITIPLVACIIVVNVHVTRGELEQVRMKVIVAHKVV